MKLFRDRKASSNKGMSKTDGGNFDSTKYWENRYSDGKNSGAGSYGRLARFKADVLNKFVANNNVNSIIEWGCGDGNQLSLAKYPRYIGIDVSETSIKNCLNAFKEDSSKSFIYYKPKYFNDSAGFLKADVALSLDVIFHLVEDRVFEKYMNDLFQSATRFVVIYASNKDEDARAKHVKHRMFTEWVKTNKPTWSLEKSIENKFPYQENDPDNTSFSDFYIYKFFKP